MANELVWHQLEILSAERVTAAGTEIRERHLVRAADFGVQVMNFACKAIRGKPLGHCVRIKERPINSLRHGPEHSVESNRVYVFCWHNFIFGFLYYDERNGRCKTSGG